MIRQLTVTETTKAFNYPRNTAWSEYGEKLALCKIGAGIEVEAPEGRTVVACAVGVRGNAKTRGIKIQAHMDRRTRKVVFKRIG